MRPVRDAPGLWKSCTVCVSSQRRWQVLVSMSFDFFRSKLELSSYQIWNKVGTRRVWFVEEVYLYILDRGALCMVLKLSARMMKVGLCENHQGFWNPDIYLDPDPECYQNVITSKLRRW